MTEKRRRLSVIIFLLFAVAGINAFAAGTVAMLESHTNDTDFSVYVRGVYAQTDVSVQIGTGSADSVASAVLSDLEMPMQTLIMVDNSISIPTGDRTKIYEFIQNMISDKLSGEQMALATFSEDINMLCDYTDDSTVLCNALDSMEYINQETYLTDVLYDLIMDDFVDGGQDIYRRIIVVSDGVDNKPIGYTKDELNALLKEYPVPIYTIGSSTGSNNEELENMFAISRGVSVDYFLWSEYDNTGDIVSALASDRDIVKVTITPTSEAMDGSKKTVKLNFADGSAVSVDIKMPQQVNAQVQESSEEIVEESSEEESQTLTQEEEEEEVEEVEEETDSKIPLIVALVAVAVLIIVGVVVLIVITLKKNQGEDFESADDIALNKMITNQQAVAQPNRQQVDTFNTRTPGSQTNYKLVLTDINSPTKVFSVPLMSNVVIGRNPELCNMTLGYDNSVSGRHCVISTRNGAFYISDIQSANGTYINGNRIFGETQIFPGNVIKLGRLEMRFDVRT